MSIPVGLAGTLTILVLVGCGIFLYPWLFKRRGGFLIVAMLTVLLTVLFYLFDDSLGVETSTSATLAVVWALLPVMTASLVHYFRRRGVSH
jgi:hypothetical protein